jgi:hypothetical protein
MIAQLSGFKYSFLREEHKMYRYFQTLILTIYFGTLTYLSTAV